MAQIQTKTPLANLVNDRLSNLGLTHTDLVERMGFSSLDKGLRRLP